MSFVLIVLVEIASPARKLFVSCSFSVGGLAMTVSCNDGSNGLAMTCVRHCEPKISELVPMFWVWQSVLISFETNFAKKPPRFPKP